jgi:hypothetical protein
MITSEARVPTSRAGRYLAQLCDHTARLGRLSLHHGHGGGPAPRHAERSGPDGVIDFESGRCMLHATTEQLLLTAEATDQDQLQRIQDGITARLQKIGRRDHLTVTWTPAAPGPGQPSG